MATQEFDPIYSLKLVNYLTWKRVEIKRFQAKMFVFTVEAQEKRYKILQVFFGNDGSLYVSFPYFDNNQGIISIGTLSEISPSTVVELETLGKVTTNKVKYAHHSNGDVHFSQTGKIETVIEKKSIPLTHTNGHIFSFHIQGLAHFTQVKTNSDPPPKLRRTELNFKFENTPEAIKIVGRWYDAKTFMARAKGSSFGPIIPAQTPDGKRSLMFLIGTPEGSDLEDHLLAINCEELPFLSEEKEASMLFIAGFGKSRDSILYEKETFLCASYPVLDFDQVKKRIGSVDSISSL